MWCSLCLQHGVPCWEHWGAALPTHGPFPSPAPWHSMGCVSTYPTPFATANQQPSHPAQVAPDRLRTNSIVRASPRHREQRFGNALISFSPSIPIDDPFGGAVADPSGRGSYPWARPNVQREFSTPQMGQRPGLRSPVEPPGGAVGCSGVLPVLPQLWQKSGAKTSGLQGLREAAILLLTKDLSMHFFFLFF